MNETQTADKKLDISLIRNELQQIIGEVIGGDVRIVPDDVPILDLGVSSLALVEGMRQVYDRFGVLVSIRRVIEGQVTLGGLALYIEQELNIQSSKKRAPAALKQWKIQHDVPLAPAQHHIGFLYRYSNEAAAAFNEALLLRLVGPLDGPALQAAVEEAAVRYDALRTALNLESDMLSVGAGEPLELVVSTPGEIWEQQIAEIVARPFETGRRLFRAELLRLSEKEHILALVGHALVLENQALEFILDDIANLYGIFLRDGEAGTPPPSLQWADYLAMGNAVEAQEGKRRAGIFWQEVFAPGVPRLEIPGDFPRLPVKKYGGARLAMQIAPGLEKKMRGWAKKEGIKPEAVLIAAYSAFLHRLTDQKDLVIGVESEPLYPDVGIPAIARTRNMLPVRSVFNPNASFKEHITAQVALLDQAEANKDLSLSELIQLLDLPRDQSRSALFTAAFRTLKQGAVPSFTGLKGSKILPPSSGARYDIELVVVSTEMGSWLVCDYSTELVEAGTITRWLDGILTLLDSGVDEDSQACGFLPMMPSDEKELLLNGWNNTEKVFPRERTVLDLIVEQAQTRRAHTAIRYQETSLTYGQLLQRIDAIAGALQANGVKKGDRVGILLRRSLDMVPAMLATWRVGSLYVPLDSSFPKNRLAFMLSDADVQIVIANKELASAVEEDTRKLFLEDVDGNIPPLVEQGLPARGADSAMILFTSGSTGRPKGVEIRHNALVNVLLATKEALDFTPSSSMLALTTISFDIASNELFMPLLASGCVDIAEDGLTADGVQLTERIESRKPSHVQATASTWKAVLAAGWKGDRDICLVSSGEALGRETAEQLLGKCRGLWNLYGPTETTVYSSAYRVTTAPGKAMRIGRPLPNTQMYVVDNQFQLVPIGAIGDLYIGGEGLAVGYWQRPELTNERFVTNPFHPGERIYRTGDLARYLPDGDIVCLGRIDDQVKIHGVRVELGEVEAALRNMMGVLDAVVVSWVDAYGDSQLVGHVIPNDKATLTAVDLRAKLRERLPEVMVPPYIIFADAFPLTANGKIQRATLPSPSLGKQNSQENGHLEAPSTATEQALARAWAAVLKIDVQYIGRDSDFMDLGGHSLLMTSLMIKVRELFQVSFNLRELFSAPTIRKFAALIDERQHQDDGKNNGNQRSTVVRSTEWARQRMAFLQREAQLPPYITPGRGLTYQPRELRKVFITGATGFLGAYIVAEILKNTTADLYCLVRPKRNENSKTRIEKQMRQYRVWNNEETWQAAWQDRIHVVEGDVTLPRMGMPDPVYETLAHDVDAILNGAAHVNFIYPYEALRATNVLGLHEVIGFAFHARIKPIHHISTAAIWPMGSQYTYFERDSIDHTGALNLGYDEAKWVGERCLLHAGERGLPVARYRPGEVGGDSVTGHSVTDHFLFACLKGFLQYGAFPALDIEVDVAPVDYVARALVHLMFRKNPLQRAFHLTNPDRRRMSEALVFLRNLGYHFEEIPFENLRDGLVNSRDFSLNALFAYQAALEEMNDVSMQLPTYDTHQTQRELEGSGIVCPPADEKLLGTYMRYLLQTGFIPQPEALLVQT